ncbi:Uncharacterised protein [Enterobacter hormaechei]|nr:Uncharacterised protein [Enterobacter hormaechei]SAB46232.1 Uncharacterised protein [Enterobacter hormaechei]
MGSVLHQYGPKRQRFNLKEWNNYYYCLQITISLTAVLLRWQVRISAMKKRLWMKKNSLMELSQKLIFR